MGGNPKDQLDQGVEHHNDHKLKLLEEMDQLFFNHIQLDFL